MKKIIFSIFAIAAILTSCNKNEPQVDLKAEGVTIYASIEDDATKTTYDEGSILWADGDAILVLNAEGGIDPYVLSDGDGSKNGVFTSTSTVKDAGMALYPAGKHAYDGTTLTVNLPVSYGNIQTEYTPNTNVPMVGFGENGSYSFSHLGAALCVTVAAPAGTQEVSLTASGIAGDFKATMADGKIAKADDAADVTVSWLFKPLAAAADMVFYFPVPTGKYQNLKIDVKDASTTLFSKSLTFSAAKELSRAQIAMLPKVTGTNDVNMDFEDGNEYSFIYWGNASGGISTTVAKNGSKSYYLTNTTAGQLYESQAAYDLGYSLDMNKTYMVSFYVKSDAAGQIQFVTQNNPNYEHQSYMNPVETTADWKYYEVKFSPSFDDINRLLINFGSIATTYYIDDFHFGEAAPSTNLITNGGFEAGIEGWNDFSWNTMFSYEPSAEGYEGNCALFTLGVCQNFWDAQIFWPIELVPGKSYSYSFWAKSDSSLPVQFTNQNDNYEGIYRTEAFTTTEEWTKYSGTFDYTESDPAGICRVGLQFGKADAEGAKLWLDSIVFTEN